MTIKISDLASTQTVGWDSGAAGAGSPDTSIGRSGVATLSAIGNLTFGTDNTYDIGASGANRPRNYYGAGFINLNGNMNSDSVVAAFGVYIRNNSGNLNFGAADDLVLTRAAAATLQFGGGDAAAPVAQTLQAQSVVAGTSNTVGATFKIGGSKSTGSAAGGAIQFSVALAGSGGTAQNALTDIVKIDGAGNMIWNTNNTYNVGAFSGNSPNTIFATTALFTYGSIYLASDTTSFILGTANDAFIKRAGAGTIQFGSADAAAPVAQTLQVQSVVTGTADTAGVNWTYKGSASTGSGASGNIVFQVAGKGAASTTVNTYNTGLTVVGGTTNNTNVGYPSVVVGTAALATTATDGFLYIPSSAGQPAGTPTSFTGRVALCYDTTNHQFWIYDGGWKQPKTPGAAAIITWQ